MTEQEAIQWLRDNFGSDTGASTTVQQSDNIPYDDWRKRISGKYYETSELREINTKGGTSAVGNSIPTDVWNALSSYGKSIHLIYQGVRTLNKEHDTTHKMCTRHGDGQGRGQTQLVKQQSEKYVSARGQFSVAPNRNLSTPTNFTNLTDMHLTDQKGPNKVGSVSDEVNYIRPDEKTPDTGEGIIRANAVGGRYATLLNGGAFNQKTHSGAQPGKSGIYDRSISGSTIQATQDGGTIQWNSSTVVYDSVKQKYKSCPYYELTSEDAGSGSGLADLNLFAGSFMLKYNVPRFNYCYGLVIYEGSGHGTCRPKYVIYSPLRIIEKTQLDPEPNKKNKLEIVGTGYLTLQSGTNYTIDIDGPDVGENTNGPAEGTGIVYMKESGGTPSVYYQTTPSYVNLQEKKIYLYHFNSFDFTTKTYAGSTSHTFEITIPYGEITSITSSNQDVMNITYSFIGNHKYDVTFNYLAAGQKNFNVSVSFTPNTYIAYKVQIKR